LQFAKICTVVQSCLFQRLSLLELNVFLLTQLEEEGVFRNITLPPPSHNDSSSDSEDMFYYMPVPIYPTTLHLWVLRTESKLGGVDSSSLCPTLSYVLLFTLHLANYFELQILKQETPKLRGKV
jgi:hypothetical protein